MSGLNVRNLINRFEELTSDFVSNEPKTPLTPKPTSYQFFPETKYAQNNTSNVKLLKLEQQIVDIKRQVRAIDEVSNDDFVRILFSLLNLLIDLATIEPEGNANVKQRKNGCFSGIIACKDELVGCLDEEFAVSNGILSANMQERMDNIRRYEETPNFDENSTLKPLQVSVRTNEHNSPLTPEIVSLSNEDESLPNEGSLVGGVSKLAHIFESKGTAVPRPQFIEYAAKEDTYFDDVTEATSPKSSTGSENSVKTVIHNEEYESSAEIKLASVRKLRDMFESKSTEELSPARSKNKLHEEEQTLPETVVIDIAEQKRLMETLLAELDYYKSLIASMDPEDEVRAEVLEENLVEMFIEINKFETCGEQRLSAQKENAIALTQQLQEKINAKKTNIGSYINDLEVGERRRSQLPPAGDFDAILTEVARYKQLVAEYSLENGKANGAFLEENICEVLLLLDNYQPDDEAEMAKKMRAIKDLGMILNELTSKKETKHEKHLIAVCPKSPHNEQNELLNDENFKNYIAVCPPAPANYIAVPQPETEDYVAVCPTKTEDKIASVGPSKTEDTIASVRPSKTEDTIASVGPSKTEDTIASVRPSKTEDTIASVGPSKTEDTIASVGPSKTEDTIASPLEDEIAGVCSPPDDKNAAVYPTKTDDQIAAVSPPKTEDPIAAICPPKTTEQPAAITSSTSNTINLPNDDDSLSFKDAEEDFDKEFDELVSAAEEEAADRLKDICGEVKIFQGILRELQIFDADELEMFKRNVADLEDVLINLQCGGNDELELRRKETIEAVREMQNTLERV